MIELKERERTRITVNEVKGFIKALNVQTFKEPLFNDIYIKFTVNDCCFTVPVKSYSLVVEGDFNDLHIETFESWEQRLSGFIEGKDQIEEVDDKSKSDNISS